MNIWERVKVLERRADQHYQLIADIQVILRARAGRVDPDLVYLRKLHDDLVDALHMTRDERVISRYYRKGGPEEGP